jgi:hypothetical protein
MPSIVNPHRRWRLTRAARRAERRTAPSAAAAGTPAIAAKADDLEEIKKSVEDAASVSGGLWLSYLFVLSYIAIAAGAVTHEDLLLERSVKLPFLNVELPLLAFFALAPFVVIIIHAYALMHFIMLAKKPRVSTMSCGASFLITRQTHKKVALLRTVLIRTFATSCGRCCRAIFSCKSLPGRRNSAPAFLGRC